MKFIFGLGNPGKKYEHSRHNAGFMFVDYLVEEELGQRAQLKNNSKLEGRLIKSQDLLIAKPQSFMNHSGRAVQKVINYYSNVKQVLDNDQLVVAYDDLDIELGNYKLQFGTGPQSHNGLESIYQALGTDQFWHLRFGIDTRQGDRSIPSQNYVLGKLSSKQVGRLEAQFAKVIKDLKQQELI